MVRSAVEEVDEWDMEVVPFAIILSNSQLTSQSCLPFGYLKSDIWSSFMLIKYDQNLSLFFFGGCFLKIGILHWIILGRLMHGSQSLPMMHPSLFFLKLFSMRHSHLHCVPGYKFI